MSFTFLYCKKIPWTGGSWVVFLDSSLVLEMEVGVGVVFPQEPRSPVKSDTTLRFRQRTIPKVKVQIGVSGFSPRTAQ